MDCYVVYGWLVDDAPEWRGEASTVIVSVRERREDAELDLEEANAEWPKWDHAISYEVLR